MDRWAVVARDKGVYEMPLKIEFHQAQVTVAVKLIDGPVSKGLKQFSFMVLQNTEEEWAAARKQVEDALKKLQEEADADGTT